MSVDANRWGSPDSLRSRKKKHGMGKDGDGFSGLFLVKLPYFLKYLDTDALIGGVRQFVHFNTVSC